MSLARQAVRYNFVVGNWRNRTGGTCDWPTIAVVAFFWAVFSVTVVFNGRLSGLVVVPLLAVLGGLYMSLQHEVIHGHPTPWPRLNWCLVSLPLGIVHPLDRYRDTHLVHHACDLTDPVADPESYYVSNEVWQSARGLYRFVLRVNRTMAGRLTIGPLLAVVAMLRYDLAQRRRRDVQRAWSLHVVAVGAVIMALRAVDMPLTLYMLGFVVGGSSLTAMRSFVEHRATGDAARSAIVRSGWFFSFIFMNNNLHYTHHQLPGASWFRLPELTRSISAEAAVAEGAGVYRGYFSIARQYLVRPFGQPVHPRSATIDA